MNKRFTQWITALALLVFMMPALVGWGQTREDATVSYGWEDDDDATAWTITDAIVKTSGQGNSGTYAGKINTNHTYVQFNEKVYVTSFSFAFKRTSTNSNYNVYIETSTDGNTWTAVETYTMGSFSNGTYLTKTHTFDGTTECYVRFHCYNTTAVRYVDDVSVTYTTSGQQPTPTITLSETGTLNIGNYAVNTAVSPQTFTVSQSNLSADITLEADGGTLSPSIIAQGAGQTEVTWNYTTPAQAGQFTSVITATSGETSASFSYMGYAYTPHNVNIATMEHGTVTPNPTSTFYWEIVTLTVTPDQGYELEELTVVDVNNDPVDVSSNYSFHMPDSDVTVYATFVEAAPTTTVTDVLNRAFTGVTGSSYSDWSGKTSNSDAVYAGQSAGGNSSIQLRATSPSGIVSTTSGGKFKKVTVTWNSNTSSGRTLNVYGKNTAYSAASDLYASNTQGTLLGTIVKGTSTELSISGDYTFVGLRSASGAMYIDEIDIDWEVSGTSVPSISAENVNIAYDATNGNIAYTINNSVEGGSISANTTSDWLTLGNNFTSPIAFTCSANTAATERTATVTLTYTYGNRETVTKDVTITQAAAPLIYTTIPALFEAATSTATSVLVTFNNWVVSGVSTNGKNVYVTDNNGNGFVIFDANGGLGQIYSVGNTLSGSAVTCSLKLNYGYAQLSVNTSELTINTGGIVNVAEIAMADLAGVNTGALVSYDNLTCSVSNNKYYLTDGTTTIQLYNALYAFDALVADKVYNITGVYQQYNNTKEILPRSVDDIEEVISTEPSATVTPDMVNAPFTGEEGTLTVTYENITEIVAEVYFCDAEGVETTYDWIQAEIDSCNNVYYLIDANNGAARTAYLKVYTMDDDALDVYSNLVTINQAEYVIDYAELPFEYAGGTLSDFSALNGTSFDLSDVGSYAAGNAPYRIKFTQTGDYLQVKCNERPGVVTIGVKLFYTGNNSKITVQGSADGITFTDIQELTISASSTGIQSLVTTETFDETYRYVKLLFTKGVNVGVGPITISKIYTLPIIGYGNDNNVKTGWNLIASPVASVVPTEANGFLTHTYDLYRYNQSADLEWENIKTHAEFTALVSGEGYLYANSDDVTLSFAGLPYNGDGSVTLSYDDDAEIQGANLIGNPFATTAYLSDSRDFYRMNADGSEVELADASNGGSAIRAFEGIFVVAAGANDNSVTFVTDDPSLVTETASNNSMIALNLTQNRGTTIDNARIRFGEGHQLPKLKLFENSTKLYIAQNDKDYAVVRSDAQGEMPVNFKANANGQYTLTIHPENVEMNYLHLIDNMTGADIDLLKTPSYTFNAKTNDYESRFRLVYSVCEDANGDNETFAFFTNGSWYINNMGEATLQVVDMLGHILSSQSVNGNVTMGTDHLSSGIYVMRLVSNDNVKTQKIVVK